MTLLSWKSPKLTARTIAMAAIAAGVLGFDASDPRVPNSRQIAREQGIDIRFVEESGESPIHHPNTAVSAYDSVHSKLICTSDALQNELFCAGVKVSATTFHLRNGILIV